MIKLQEDRVLVRDGGALTALDLADWRVMIGRCCRAAGVKDHALPEDLVRIVKRFCAQREREGRHAAIEEVDALVVQVLLDAGLRDAAGGYQQARQMQPLSSGDEERVRLGQADLEFLLKGDPFFLTRPTAGVCERLRQSLAQLGLQVASVPFLRALARELWWQEAPAPMVAGGAEHAAHGCWLISRDEMQTLVAEHGSSALLASDVRVGAVSALVPALRIELDMVAVARYLGGDTPTELLLIPSFESLAVDLNTLLMRLRRQIENRRERPEPDALPITVTLMGCEALTTQIIPMRGRRAADFRAEMRQILSVALQEDLKARILLA